MGACFHHFFQAFSEHSGHVLGFPLGLHGALDHVVAFFDGFVQIFENLHVVDVPVVSSFHFRNGHAKVVVKFLGNAEDLPQTVLFTGVLLFHLVKLGLKMFDSLRGLGGSHLQLTHANILLCNDGFKGFLLDLSVNDLLFEHFNFCSCIDQFLFLRFISSKQLLKAVGFGGQRLFELLDEHIRRQRTFRH